jgi:hypothetical protein
MLPYAYAEVLGRQRTARRLARMRVIADAEVRIFSSFPISIILVRAASKMKYSSCAFRMDTINSLYRSKKRRN